MKSLKSKQQKEPEAIVLLLTVRAPAQFMKFHVQLQRTKELQNKPHRKQSVIKKIKSFNKENPNDMPVIRMVNASYDMVVTTRGREAELK